LLALHAHFHAISLPCQNAKARRPVGMTLRVTQGDEAPAPYSAPLRSRLRVWCIPARTVLRYTRHGGATVRERCTGTDEPFNRVTEFCRILADLPACVMFPNDLTRTLPVVSDAPGPAIRR
jgi:hypothetical protein